jgi:hypothetical protein
VGSTSGKPVMAMGTGYPWTTKANGASETTLIAAQPVILRPGPRPPPGRRPGPEARPGLRRRTRSPGASPPSGTMPPSPGTRSSPAARRARTRPGRAPATII